MNVWARRQFFQLFGPEDDSTSSSGGAVGTGNDARLKLLSDINDQNDEDRADELALVNDDDTTEPFRAVAEEVVDEEVGKEVVEEVADEEVVEEPKKFKIKVNGRELELTEEELIARAQKVESADQYLADAARSKRVAAEPEEPKGPTAEELRRQQDEEERAIVRAIQMGSEEEALEAVRKLQSRSQRPSVTADDMSRAIDERLAFNEAITSFRSNFADIAGDPLLNQLALSRDAQLLEQGDERSYKSRYEQIGKELRAWKESLAPTPTEEIPAKDTSLEEKVVKKKSAPKPVSAASAKVTQPKEEDDDGEEDASTVIANIAKHRGGPQWMRG
jgi:hypothetical protein